MTDIIALSAPSLQAFLLALLRTGGFVIVAPALSHRTVPASVKIGLSIIIAWALVPQLVADLPAAPIHLAQLAIMGVREVLTGIIIGFSFALLFAGLQAAGELVGLQVGFALANIYDYQTERQVGVLGQLELLLGVLLFFAIDGHHLMLRAFFDSYRVVGVSGLQISAAGLDVLVRLSTIIFVIAIKAAAPVMAAIFLSEIALGILARTVPQMNVFIIGFPLKIGVGLFMLATALPLFSIVFANLLQQVGRGLDQLLAALV
jgi:flagellar biosynthetic protein FliR